MRVIKNYLPAIALVLSFLILWELITRIFSVPHYILPSPSLILSTIIGEPQILISNSIETLKEVVLGFIIAFMTGISLALVIFYSETMRRVVYPLVIASQTIPVFAIAPLLVVWFGYGILSKVAMSAIIVFFPIVVNTVDGLRSVDPDMVNLLKTMRANELQILKKLRFPSALPFILSGTKIGIAVSVIGAVIGEWVGAKKGLGYLMIHANAQLRIDLIFASIVFLSAMGVFLFLLVQGIEYWLLPWKRVKGG